ncbi:transcription elongation factor [Sulfuracidifex metallicus]|jgi:transcription elongation factor Elf1|uniref:Transcription elongation factor n=1 Tax=Sulfuracidifex metallicus DSM 6482 = JCM 9184 TaxID=523847 RepID=A0A6A9QS56_SULME|nr:transcription elongation factor [Sulfuracidifex metallicus]MUN28623.1 transcription elongation factor [Sulfuracidifex metallicus DSM 6482 = JCM 9184]WOE50847.1 transcription elongation factor [Sulfuracidifex metallicus DSM 6482 = JCM 9184]
MGGKRKKRTKPIRVRPKVPSTFECPRCGKVSINIKIKNGMANITCGACGLHAEIEVPPVFDNANAYGKFLDMYLEGEIEISDEENNQKEEEENYEDEGKSEELHQ